MSKVWGIHNDKVPASELVAEGFISIGWDEIGDLRAIGDDQTAIKDRVTATYPDAKAGAIPGNAGVLRRFAFELAEGDLVVAPNKQRSTFNIGRAIGPYEFRADAPLHRHRRPVEWLVIDASREAFSQTARYEMGSAITFFQVANHADEFEAAVRDGVPEMESKSEPEGEQVRYGLLQRTTLEILRDSGSLQRREVIDAVANRLDLTGFELFRTKSGIPRFEAALSWGSVDMQAAGWIEKAEGEWSITDAGRDFISAPPADPEIAKLSSGAYREAQAAKREERKRFKTARYPLIDAAVKLVPEGQWITYSDIGNVVGTNGPSVGEYVHGMDLEGHHRVVPVGQPPYRSEFREALEEEGVEFDERGLPDPTKHMTAEDLREEMDLLGLLPKVTRRAWLVRGSSVQGKDLVPTWLAEGWISVAASNLREVHAGMTRDELKPIIDDDYAHASYHVKGEKLDEFHAFLTKMEDGHLVITVDQGRTYVGTLVGEPRYQASIESDSNLVRDVAWSPGDGYLTKELPGELTARLKVQRDVLDLTQQLNVIEQLLEAEDTATPLPEIEPVVLADATAELAEELHVPHDWLQECIDLLNDRPQLIFYGPPGTGKTYIAQALAKHVAGDNVRLVQFHPAYSYEDFFEGFRPVEEGGFKLKFGPMRKIVDQAVQNPRDAFVLIIDEINRGNLAKVFGELYFLLEYRDQNVELLYADGDFSLPKNVFIIGTMNTADRSIALVDAAMRRRFAFLPLHPAEIPTSGILRRWLSREELPARTADMLDELNSRIADADFKIGPSYFMRRAVYDDSAALDRMWRTSILPLLEEHHFGEMDGAAVRARYGIDAIASTIDGLDDAPSDPA